MLAGLARRGDDGAALLARCGIDLADAASRIPLERYAALYNAVIAALDDEGFGLFSQPLRRGSFEFLCRAAMGAPTLAVGLERACRFLDLVLPDMRVEIERGGEFARLHIAERRPLAEDADDPGRVFAFEWLLRLVHGLAGWLAGRGLALETVSFPYAPPAHVADYALVYTADSHFGAPMLTARLRDHLLELPIRRDEAALQAFLDGAPGKIAMLYRRDRDMVLRVRDLLRAALPEVLGVDTVAARLHMSPRTLHRRLEEEGSGFRTIKDALRRDIALARLAKSDQPVAELAAALGYADPSAFYRACVAWTGLSPDRYRRQLRGGLDAPPDAP
ncbi:AraC family transcriptional regulator [Nitrogeniibacter mangrovi]|uniref:AraC family transcriptional regulator n=1 Tax=Nitrogeniibacter mangrovi TaxID=2016596 RepID=A0A6C1B8V2_9RHOO|nr:AraC family transcriptional regulator [Nitrogeniibacter mangrovi]QID19907.1 AraC family transcriptional regulator [Nitrogeniibacter mangrovi]